MFICHRKVLLSGLIAIVAAFLWRLLGTTSSRLISTINCSSKDNGNAFCELTRVCFKASNSGHGSFIPHTVKAFGVNSVPNNPAIAFLISTSLFPQSAVHITVDDDDTSFHQSLYFEPDDTYIFTRFKPDNLMHVVHDDILPTYAVLTEIYGRTLTQPFPVKLKFADSHGNMVYDELYQELSLHPIDTLPESETCYEKLIVGFDKTTLWYQYGFHTFQGPLAHNKSHVSGLIRDLYPISSQTPPARKIVLFSRTETRLILNEAELSLALARKYSVSVKVLSLEAYTLPEIRHELSSACMVIGMHGALFSSVIWLPANATVVELFPYAVPPENYTPYRTLSNILSLRYISWENKNQLNSLGHPDFPKEFGGIYHLPKEQQQRIITTSQVQQHYCCSDPSWLYHIYQDTAVNTSEILQLLEPL